MRLILMLLTLLSTMQLQAQNWGSLDLSPGSTPKVVTRTEPGTNPGEYFFHLEIPPGYYQDKDSPFFRIEAMLPFRTVEVLYPDAGEREGVSSYQGTVTLKLTAQGPDQGAVPDTITIRTGYQICQKEGICLLPVEETVTLPWNRSGGGADITGPHQGWDTWGLQLLFAFLGGFLLNLMPCVFPLLSVKSLALMRGRDQGEKRQRNLAWWYGAGIMASLFAVALFMIFLKVTGEAAGWGFYFQNPGFVLFLTALLWGFALSLLGVYSLPAGTVSSGLSTPRGALLSGLFAVLAAAPCTAPFLGSAMGFAFSQPPEVLPFFFLVAGAGFALPYILLAHIPGLLKWLPKPGPWMETFEHLMGFLLAAWALVTVASLESQISREAFWNTVIFLFILAMVLWALGRWARPVDPPLRRRILWLLGLFTLVGGGFFTASSFVPKEQAPEAATAEDTNGWVKFNTEILEEARSQGRPVFVDIWAQWCTNCKINEALVLSRPEVLAALDNAGVLRLKGDLTRPDRELTEFLSSHGRAGLPFYVYFAPGKEPQILPEILTSAMITGLVEP